jgi:plastocyanin
MMSTTWAILTLWLLVTHAGEGEAAGPSYTGEPEPEVLPVRMYDKGGGQWGFDPEHIQAAPGTIVRFVMDDIVPHNVEFTETPSGVDLGAVRMGPFLLRKGDAYDVVIDERFLPGVYTFVCTPHAILGMTGTMEVTPAEGPRS